MHILKIMMHLIMHNIVVLQLKVMMHIDAYSYYYCSAANDIAYYCCSATYCHGNILMHIVTTIVLMGMLLRIIVVLKIVVMAHIDAYGYYYCSDGYAIAYYCCSADCCHGAY